MNNKRTFKQRQTLAPRQVRRVYKVDDGPAWTKEQKERMLDVFYTLHKEGKLKAG